MCLFYNLFLNVKVFGSGWAWLYFDTTYDQCHVIIWVYYRRRM